MTLIYPVDIKKYPVTQRFGNKFYITDLKSPLYIRGKEDYYARFGLNGHDGEDQGCPIGTKACASHDGRVTATGYDPVGYGNYVRLENSIEGSIYGHLSDITVKVGYSLKQGDQFGLTGNSGGSTGPHIHWGYFRLPRNKSNGFDGYINPSTYLIKDGSEEVMDNQTGLNTYGLDDTNVDSKQVVYDTWHDVTSGLYMRRTEYEEEVAKNKTLEADLLELQKKLDNNFQLLKDLSDLGINSIADFHVIADPYKEMYLAGYANLSAINNKLNNHEFTYTVPVTETTGSDTPTVTTTTDVKQPTKLAQLLEILKKILSFKKTPTTIEQNVINMDTEKVDEVVNEWEKLNKLIKGENV